MARPDHTEPAGYRARRLRSRLTVSEARLWAGVKNRGSGARFRRQVPIGPWIVDFASFDPKLIIEVDDTSHDWKDESDRTAYLESLGFTVLRFTNHQIATDAEAAVATVAAWVSHLNRTGRPPEP